ncbi:hypothetical protein D9758_009330 [Tetrapyrgos nigripes]|uniref:Cyclin N-terminal domain-containing protein n=1 Tax=Tetrapyrgos nigripes TaxID=182062 RepID=A0A8H5GGU1_9AGAR|nr:hypothetical protein D9758_009330 [Tetrapyrgos nigripes]
MSSLPVRRTTRTTRSISNSTTKDNNKDKGSENANARPRPKPSRSMTTRTTNGKALPNTITAGAGISEVPANVHRSAATGLSSTAASRAKTAAAAGENQTAGGKRKRTTVAAAGAVGGAGVGLGKGKEKEKEVEETVGVGLKSTKATTTTTRKPFGLVGGTATKTTTTTTRSMSSVTQKTTRATAKSTSITSSRKNQVYVDADVDEDTRGRSRTRPTSTSASASASAEASSHTNLKNIVGTSRTSSRHHHLQHITEDDNDNDNDTEDFRASKRRHTEEPESDAGATAAQDVDVDVDLDADVDVDLDLDLEEDTITVPLTSTSIPTSAPRPAVALAPSAGSSADDEERIAAELNVVEQDDDGGDGDYYMQTPGRGMKQEEFERDQGRQGLVLKKEEEQEQEVQDWDDLDADDFDDPLQVSEYINEITAYMKELETKHLPTPNYIALHTELDWEKRQILVDWILQLVNRYAFLPETFFLSVNLIDRFLSLRQSISLERIQLMGISCFSIASKFEEGVSPSLSELAHLTGGTFSAENISRAERYVLKTIKYEVSGHGGGGGGGPMSWLRRGSKADDLDVGARTIGKYLLEAACFEGELVGTKPSLVAAASLWLGRIVLGREEWTPNLIHYTTYKEHELLPTANVLLNHVLKDISPQYNETVYKKHASRKYMKSSIFIRKWALSRFPRNANVDLWEMLSVIKDEIREERAERELQEHLARVEKEERRKARALAEAEAEAEARETRRVPEEGEEAI